MSTPRPWTAAGIRLSPPTVRRYGPGTGLPVLLHHGFLVDSNAPWHRSGMIERLAAGGFDAVVITEHFVREAGRAHAFGHDATLLLAQTLADVIDGLGAAEAGIVAAGSGAAPALVAAANDARVRWLVLADPAGVQAVPGGLAVSLEEPAGPTAAELDLAIPCVHGDVPPLAPAPGLRLRLEAVAAPTLIITRDTPRRSPAGPSAGRPR